MNTKEKAPTSAATLTGAAAEMTACRASIPISDCTTAAAGRQRKVSELLNRGREIVAGQVVGTNRHPGQSLLLDH